MFGYKLVKEKDWNELNDKIDLLREDNSGLRKDRLQLSSDLYNMKMQRDELEKEIEDLIGSKYNNIEIGDFNVDIKTYNRFDKRIEIKPVSESVVISGDLVDDIKLKHSRKYILDEIAKSWYYNVRDKLKKMKL